MLPEPRHDELDAVQEGFENAFEDGEGPCLCYDLSHKILETEDVERAREVIAERHQAPFATYLVEAADEKVTVAGAAFEGAEGVFDNPRTTAHQFARALHPCAVTVENIFVLPATNGPLRCFRAQTACL